MDKEKSTQKIAFSESFVTSLRAEAEKRKSERGALTADIFVFLCAFFFARRHTVFGTYPLGVGLVAVLPSRVIIGFLGALCGSLSLGRAGVIHAIISLIVFLLRIIICAGFGQQKRAAVFSEPLIMRLSAAAIGAFVGAGYEMLLSGFSFSSILFGVFGVGLTIGFSFVFSGLFVCDLSVADFLYGEKDILNKKEGKDGTRAAFFQISFIVTSALLVFSLTEYSYFGISFDFVFAIALTLFISKRFGALRGAATGFLCTVAISPLYSPAFALCAIGADFLFGIGISYGIIGAGILLVGWASYVSGMTGFLSLLPEFVLASSLLFAPLRRLPTEKVSEEKKVPMSKKASEMVGATWLSDRQKNTSVDKLSDALAAASERIKEFSLSDGVPDFEEYRKIVEYEYLAKKIPLNEEVINKIATKLYKKQKITDLDREDLERSGIENEDFASIISACATYDRSLYEKRRVAALAEEYEIISRMISESQIAEARGRAIDDALTEKAKEVFVRHGFPEGDIKVFGDVRKRIIAAGCDPDGKLITSPELKEALCRALGVRLGEFEYFRKDDMALFKCSALPMFRVSFATASLAGSDKEISGDSVEFFTGPLAFYSVISDGMGSGSEARESADFVTRYLSEMLLSDVGLESTASALNRIIRHKGSECTATLDLFRLNLIDGEALFVKSGAAPSYVKRDKSIFRISSETAPIGLMKNVDAEKIKVEIKSGDYVIMLSDGVSTTVEDSSWLITYLTSPALGDVKAYAEEILALAKKNSKIRDDMTVSVIRILASDEKV